MSSYGFKKASDEAASRHLLFFLFSIYDGYTQALVRGDQADCYEGTKLMRTA